MKKIYKIVISLVIICGIYATVIYAATSKGNTNNTIAQSNETSYNTVTEEYNANVNTTNAPSEEEAEPQTEDESKSNKGLGLIAAALSTGLACLGAGIAVAIVASSAVGAISENPSLLGKTIIFVGLAEGIAIYGLIISIMILNQI